LIGQQRLWVLVFLSLLLAAIPAATIAGAAWYLENSRNNLGYFCGYWEALDDESCPWRAGLLLFFLSLAGIAALPTLVILYAATLLFLRISVLRRRMFGVFSGQESPHVAVGFAQNHTVKTKLRVTDRTISKPAIAAIACITALASMLPTLADADVNAGKYFCLLADGYEAGRASYSHYCPKDTVRVMLRFLYYFPFLAAIFFGLWLTGRRLMRREVVSTLTK
jgi:hypothetical protein